LRNCLPASTMPAAHQRSATCPSRHRFTFVEWSRQISIMDSMAFVERSVRPSVDGISRSEQDCYDPARVNVANGELDLTAIAKSETYGGVTEPYATGMVTTNGTFQLRLRLHGGSHLGTRFGRGRWPAFGPMARTGPLMARSTSSRDSTAWPAATSTTLQAGLGSATPNLHRRMAHLLRRPGAGSLTFYYDGTEIWQHTSGITSAPMYLILTLALDSSISPTLVPATMRTPTSGSGNTELRRLRTARSNAQS